MPAWCRPALVILAIFEVPAPAFAQERVPKFEVATLKLSPPPAGASISINLGTFQNGRFTFGNVTLNDAVLSSSNGRRTWPLY